MKKALIIILVIILYSIPLVQIYKWALLKSHSIYKNNEGPGVSFYFPKTWMQDGDYYVNSDKTCKATGSMSVRSIDRIKQEIIPYELEYNEEIINNINMQHGHKETEEEIIETYIFKHPSIEKNYYLTYIQNKDSEAEDCKEFIDNLETRIVISY